MTTTRPPDQRLDGPIHGWFGLSYSNYQVLPRTLMQSMPEEWQQRMVACLEELRAAYAHIEHPDSYEVTATAECDYGDLNDSDMLALGITRADAPDGDVEDADAPDGDVEDADAPDGDVEDADVPDVYYDRDLNEHESWERVLVPRPGGDPIPHYNRGRTYVEPAEEV